MTAFFRNLSLRWKVISVVMLVSALVLAVSGAVVVVSDVLSMQRTLVEHVSALSRVASINTAAALAFRDPETAGEVLSALGSEPDVISIQIRTADGRIFAEHRSRDPRHGPSLELTADEEGDEWAARASGRLPTREPDAEFRDGYLDVDMAILVNEKPLGYMDVQYDTGALRQRMLNHLGLTLLVFLGGMGMAFLLAVRLHRLISRPIGEVAEAMEATAENQDFSVRLTAMRRDELGTLARTFNGMLEQIQLRDVELHKARDAAEAASRAKSQFLAAMSHEIRTPMNGIIGMTELLRRTTLSGRQRHFADTIQRSAEALLNIINDILDFSKIEAGRLVLESVDFDLREVIEDTVELLAEPAHRKGLDLTALVPPELPIRFRGDPGRLQQVLTNLLSNAIKFTEKGYVQVAASCLEETTGSVRVRIEVRDTGIGLSDAERERIFERFVQADSSTSRKYGGTGLGLTITKQLVELMGGSIGVESAPGGGAVFRIDLPLERQDHGAADVEACYPGLKVLVVDRSPQVREGLRRQLAAWGADVVCTPDLPLALDLARADALHGDPFDILVFERAQLTAPKAPAAEILREALEQAKGTVLLGSAGVEMAAAQDWGNVCSLSKPVARRALLACLEEVIRQKGISARSPDAQAVGLHPGIPRLGLRVLVAEDNPVNQAVAEGMLNALGCRATLCVEGAAALDALERDAFNLVLMDCQMPVMDGYETTRRLREREEGSGHGHVPVIALTASALAGDRERALAAGMDDYLSKPFKLADLAAMLQRWAG